MAALIGFPMLQACVVSWPANGCGEVFTRRSLGSAISPLQWVIGFMRGRKAEYGGLDG